MSDSMVPIPLMVESLRDGEPGSSIQHFEMIEEGVGQDCQNIQSSDTWSVCQPSGDSIISHAQTATPVDEQEVDTQTETNTDIMFSQECTESNGAIGTVQETAAKETNMKGIKRTKKRHAENVKYRKQESMEYDTNMMTTHPRPVLNEDETTLDVRQVLELGLGNNIIFKKQQSNKDDTGLVGPQRKREKLEIGPKSPPAFTQTGMAEQPCYNDIIVVFVRENFTTLY